MDHAMVILGAVSSSEERLASKLFFFMGMLGLMVVVAIVFGVAEFMKQQK